MVALGSEHEVKAAMNETHMAEKDNGADESPPKKKAKTELTKKNSSGKENCTPCGIKGKCTTKKGGIIIVSGESSTHNEKPISPLEQAATSPQTIPNPAQQCDTATSTEDTIKPRNPQEKTATSPLKPAEQSDTATSLEGAQSSFKTQTRTQINIIVPLELAQSPPKTELSFTSQHCHPIK